MALQNINFRADLNLPKQESLPKETKNEQVGTGQFAANSGVFHAKENVKQDGRGEGRDRGKGERQIIPNDPFIKELGLTGGYDKSNHGYFRTNHEAGVMSRIAYNAAMGSDAGLRPLKLEPGVDYALPCERSKISHAVHMAYVNKPIDMHHELNALTRQVALNRPAIRV